MTTNNDFDRLFGGKYLKADDIPEKGVAVYTISNFSIEEIGPKEEEKCLLYFHGTDKALVLNKTNGNTIGELYGKNMDDWPGKKLALYQTPVDYAGKTVMAVRIMPKVPKGQEQPPPTPEFEEGDDY